MKKLSKKRKIMILIGVAGFLLSIMVYVDSLQNTDLKDGIIQRNEWGGGSKNVKLVAKSENLSSNVNIEVEERKYSNEELEKLSLEAEALLKKEFFKYIGTTSNSETRFELINHLEGYPFTIRWNFKSDYLDTSGKVLCNFDCNESHEITLEGTLIYKDFSKRIAILVKLSHKKLSELEKYIGSVNQALDEVIENTESESVIRLPEKVNGNEIIWEEEKDYTYILVFAGSIVASFIISFAYDYDEKKKKNKIKAELFDCYPDFVEKLKLFMISGLTLKKSLEKIYEEMSKNSYRKQKAILEELEKVINQYKNGVREEIVIENFGTECGGPYKKLVYLLIVNLKQGNDRILGLLNEEVEKAMLLKKENAKKESDRAGIKILFPMMIMLLVVMSLIMIPAYLDFNK